MEAFHCKHVVLSPSYPQNSQEFKEVWVNEFVDWIRNNSTYHSIFVEHPETNYHLDILLWFPKTQRWDNYIRNFKKIVKRFLDANPASEFQNFFHASKIAATEEDILKLIGYNQKEGRGSYELPEPLRLEGIEYYEEHKKTCKIRKFMNTNPLNPKNVVCYLLEQSTSLNLQNPSKLIRRMVTEGFSFVGLSEKHMQRAKLEFKMRTGQTLSNSEEFEWEKQMGCQLDIDQQEWFINLKDNERKIMEISKVLFKNSGTIWDGEELKTSDVNSDDQIFDILAIISS